MKKGATFSLTTSRLGRKETKRLERAKRNKFEFHHASMAQGKLF
jgi:hypothetical protein